MGRGRRGGLPIRFVTCTRIRPHPLFGKEEAMRAHHRSISRHPKHVTLKSATGSRGPRDRDAVAKQLEPRRLLAAIASGQTIASRISTGTEVDTYTFNGTAGGSIIVSAGDTSNNAFYP